MQQNLTEMKRCKVNSTTDICLYGHNWMVISYGYEHINISVRVIQGNFSRVRLHKSVCRLFEYYKLSDLEYFEGQNSKF